MKFEIIKSKFNFSHNGKDLFCKKGDKITLNEKDEHVKILVARKYIKEIQEEKKQPLNK